MIIAKLSDVVKAINIKIILSFIIILLLAIVALNAVIFSYNKYEQEIISQKINNSFNLFISEVYEKLKFFSSTHIFIDYINSGDLSRKYLYDRLVFELFVSNLNKLVDGIEIFNKSGKSIFFYGNQTPEEIGLRLCYLNRRLLNFNFGNCLYFIKLYFADEKIFNALKKINPDFEKSKNYSYFIMAEDRLGRFPLLQPSSLRVKAIIVDKNTRLFFYVEFFIIFGSLLLLVIWNINGIKKVFSRYILAPINDISGKIKENNPLSLSRETPIEFLQLARQINIWTEKMIELEQIKVAELTQKEKIKTAQSIGTSIAHELRTPLRSIISGINGIEKFLPILIQTYNLAKQTNLPIKNINQLKLDLLSKALNNIKLEGTSANTIIDMFLMKVKNFVPITEMVQENLWINDCIEEALLRYPFRESERSLVVWSQENNFSFAGNKILVIHILFNLLKNSLYAIVASDKGKIYIACKNEKHANTMYFKDTGSGIKAEEMANIFERFHSNKEDGIGIGLSFCKMAMELMQGRINCISRWGSFTEFGLSFPKWRE